jgi:DNA-binding NarL/FixJ family response regulator
MRCVNPECMMVGTQKDNQQDCISKDRKNSWHRLTPEQEEKIMVLIAEGKSQRFIAGVFGVGQSLISSIKIRKS